MSDATQALDRIVKSGAEIRASGKRVGDGARDRLQWALNFSNKDVSDPSIGTVLDLYLELAAFQLSPGFSVDMPSFSFSTKEDFRLALDEVRRVHERFNDVLRSYVKEHRIVIKNDAPTNFMLTRRGLSIFTPDYVFCCAVKLMQLIAEFPEHIRQCPEDQRGCGNWFLADRRDAVFCSKTCAGRKRIFDFRERETEKKGRGN